MPKAFSPLLTLLLLAQPANASAIVRRQEAAKSVQPSQAAVASILRNEDVLTMIGARLPPEIVVAKIRNAPCDFDTSPDALKRLKAEGVPDPVIMEMVAAPKSSAPKDAGGGKDAGGDASRSVPDKVAVTVPEGSLVELETAYTINSQYVRVGDAVSFRVVNPVKVGGVIVIEPGATATARVVKASRGGHFGRAGRLAFEMQEVTAVDGTRVPLQFAGRVVGDSKGAKVATATVLMGLGLGPFAPLALLNGFKRGENAILPEGKRFEVYASRSVVVNVK